MIRRFVKWLGIGLGVILSLLVIAGIILTLRSRGMAGKVYAIETTDLTIPVDDASLAEGGRLLAIRACVNCHGDDLTGGLFVDHPTFGTYYAANLTGGQNSITANYSPADWDRAIRHGVGHDGQSLWAMPSAEYAGITDAHLAMMIAYLESLAPVDQAEPFPPPNPKLLAKLLTGSGQLPLLSAQSINHDVRPPASIPAEVSVEYGAYLASTCSGCHQADFAGGAVMGSDPDSPAPANLAPAGNLAN